MRNWLGQEIKMGDYVYRGARDGNSSSFRVGEVVGVNLVKHTATVEWLFEDGIWWSEDRVQFMVPRAPWAKKGASTIHSLVVVDKALVYGIRNRYDAVKEITEARPYVRMSADDFERATGTQREPKR